jgi:hypothetical protein
MDRESYRPGMPKRRRDKDGLFKREGVYYLQHKGRRVSLKTSDREEARRLADKYKRKAADPSHEAADLKRLDEACAEFRVYAETGENKKKPPAPPTFEMYDTHFGHFVRIWGADTRMSEIDAAAVDDYIATRRKERIGKKPEHGEDRRKFVQANTVDKELGTLRQILRLGLRRGWFHLPLDRVLPESSGGEYVPLSRHLTLEQVPLLLKALAHPYSPNQRRGGYRGVYPHTKTKGSWEVKLFGQKDGVKFNRYVGSFSDPIVAAKAYDAAALAAFGPGAQLNFPEGGSPLDDPAGRVATCAFVVATGADWCAVERAERSDLGGLDHCNLMVLIRGTKNARRWAEVPIVHPFQQFSEIARAYLAKRGSFPAWGNSMRDLAAACKRAGLPRITIRDLRRTYGKILAAHDVDPHLIGSMLRQADGRMAERVYARPERTDIGRRVANITRKAAG